MGCYPHVLEQVVLSAQKEEESNIHFFRNYKIKKSFSNCVNGEKNNGNNNNGNNSNSNNDYYRLSNKKPSSRRWLLPC